jgi:Ni/Co efflux regulator RcnB
VAGLEHGLQQLPRQFCHSPGVGVSARQLQGSRRPRHQRSGCCTLERQGNKVSGKKYDELELSRCVQTPIILQMRRCDPQHFRGNLSVKTILIGAVALSLLGGAAANAQPYSGAHHDVRYERGHHPTWRKGQRLPPQYRTRSHFVDYRRHHLHAPPRGYRWVQVDSNYALVGITSGLIASIVAGR